MKDVLTALPAEPETQIVTLSVTEKTAERFAAFRDLRVTDIHDKQQLQTVHDARIQVRDARLTLDRERKKLNEDHQAAIDSNNSRAKAILALITPIEKMLADEESRVEAEKERLRQEAINAVVRARMERLAAVGAEMDESFVRSLSDSQFEQVAVRAAVEAEQKRAMAEQAAIIRAAQEKAAQERAEQERVEQERLEAQKRAEEEARAEERRRFEAERAAFAAEQEAARRQAEQQRLADEAAAEKSRAEMKRKLDQELAEIARQKKELEDLKAEQESARRKAEQEERLQEQQRAEAERAQRIQEQDRIRREEQASIAKAMQPDLAKLRAWVNEVTAVIPEVPSVGAECQPLATRLRGFVSMCVDNLWSAVKEGSEGEQ